MTTDRFPEDPPPPPSPGPDGQEVPMFRIRPGAFGKEDQWMSKVYALADRSESLDWHVNVDSWIPYRVQILLLWVWTRLLRRPLPR